MKLANSSRTIQKEAQPSIDWKALLEKDIQLFGGGFPVKKKAIFYSQLQTLLDAGLDIQQSLNLVAESFEKKHQKQIIIDLKEQIINGDSLSETMQKSKQFSDYEAFSIQIGEESGKLQSVLKELSSYYEKSLAYRRQLTKALSYPVFVMGFAILVVIFMLNFLVPQFGQIYKRFGGELPQITQKVIAMSDWLTAYGPYLLLGFVSIIVFLYLNRMKRWFKKMSALVLLKMPIFGKIIKLVFLSRYCQSLGLMLSAQVPLMQAVNLVKKMVNFHPIEHSLDEAEKAILNGASLNHSLSKHTFYPYQMIALIKVGEESGKLQQMLGKLSDQYNEEIDQRTAVVGSLIEPILIVFLGVIVGFILIAMYLPLFQMSSNVG